MSTPVAGRLGRSQKSPYDKPGRPVAAAFAFSRGIRGDSRRVANLLIFLLLVGCTYNGVLRTSALSYEQPLAVPSDSTVALSSDAHGINPVTFTVYAVTFNYDPTAAFMGAARAMLESVYGTAGAPAQSPRTLLAIPHLSATTLSTTRDSAEIQIESRIDLVDTSSQVVARSYGSVQRVDWVEPSSARTLGVLTGLSLLVLSPITIPAAIQVEGEHGRDLLERAIYDSMSEMRVAIAADRKRSAEAAQISDCFRRISTDDSLTIISTHLALDSVKAQTLDMLASTQRPTEDEKRAIGHWASLLSVCHSQQIAAMERWNVPGSVRALFNQTSSASRDLRALLYSGAMTYGEFARERQKISDAFEVAEAKIEVELGEKSAEATARANELAMQAQRLNLAAIQTRQMELQTTLIGIQTVNQATSIVQQQAQHQQLMNQLSRPRSTSCQINQYIVNCTSW
jgi:hypothetical protein